MKKNLILCLREIMNEEDKNQVKEWIEELMDINSKITKLETRAQQLQYYLEYGEDKEGND